MTTADTLPPNDASRLDYDAIFAPCLGALTVNLHYGNDADTQPPYMRDSRVLVGGEVTVSISGPANREEKTTNGRATFDAIPCGIYTVEAKFTGTDRMVEEALPHVGSRRWAYWRSISSFDGQMSMRPATNKCNFFAYDMIERTFGVSPSFTRSREGWRSFFGDVTAPVLARHWSETQEPDLTPDWLNIEFQNRRTPVPPGAILAIARESIGASGHVGIIAYPEEGRATVRVDHATTYGASVIMQGRTISADFEKVVHNDWGFRTSRGDGGASLNNPTAGIEVREETEG
ncbi:hypothetical protein [Roseinatronobacter monicus]|uniref:CHAP domain-containing protein n=1 Tax=Roseinatronobacter monicus TaxID=393481 RepID=A0A543K5N3_9RHOB|nr:hypothetical protein [Roseinatronobacter monicus]TQM90375.1 hypothetical protein BD293_3753 [Roseinatronobacter monicus]